MERRNTIQKELVLDAVRELKCHASAQEVYEFIIKKHPNLGKGTVYRNLNILSEEGEIQKVEVPGGADRFDHTLHKHYHVSCIKCGKVSDVDMDVLPDLTKKIKDKQGMKFLGYDVVFTGICSGCQAKEH